MTILFFPWLLFLCENMRKKLICWIFEEKELPRITWRKTLKLQWICDSLFDVTLSQGSQVARQCDLKSILLMKLSPQFLYLWYGTLILDIKITLFNLNETNPFFLVALGIHIFYRIVAIDDLKNIQRSNTRLTHCWFSKGHVLWKYEKIWAWNPWIRRYCFITAEKMLRDLKWANLRHFYAISS